MQHMSWTAYQNLIRDLKSDKFDLENIQVRFGSGYEFPRYVNLFREKDGKLTDKQRQNVEFKHVDLVVKLGAENYIVHMWSAPVISAALSSLLRREDKGNLDAKVNQKS